MTKSRYINILIILVLTIPICGISQTRIKDLAEVDGMISESLIGYGLVVGLEGTGDTPRSLFTNQTLLNMLDRFGISIQSERVRVRNVAGVIVTASLPPFKKEGQKIDVIVSSIGDSRSLAGGTLLMTPLVAMDGNIYGTAQGPVSLGGFTIESEGSSVSKNKSAVGRVPGGMMIERALPFSLDGLETFSYSLFEGDYTTSSRIAEAINTSFGENIARSLDPVTVEVQVAEDYPGGAMALIASTEVLTINPDSRAKVIVNERTGTVVIGGNVKLSNVAITHGALSISIASRPVISQPGAFSPGTTVQERMSQINVEQEGTQVTVIPESNNVGDVATALNNLGVTPRDIISIFQALKEAGALQAELIII